MDRASVSGTEGQQFEPAQAYHFKIKSLAHKIKPVENSIITCLSTNINNLDGFENRSRALRYWKRCFLISGWISEGGMAKAF
jgi:hypothetical protein